MQLKYDYSKEVLMPEHKRIGEILVEQKLITQRTLDRALSRADRLHQKIGFALEEMDVITDQELAKALASQVNCKIAKNFYGYKFSASLLKLIPAEMAIRRLVFPLKKEGQKLAVAMADPAEYPNIRTVVERAGLELIPFVATRRDIITAINRHYFGKDTSRPDKPTVLVVEDDKLIYTQVQDMLTKEGYQVLVAVDGMQAYKMALSEFPHVIITDKVMPKINGYALFDTLQNMPETAHVPILLLTGSTDPEEEAKALEKGFFDYLSKPVKKMTLLTRVRRAFRSIEDPNLPETPWVSRSEYNWSGVV
jgi:CheY-like chemotaxis protein